MPVVDPTASVLAGARAGEVDPLRFLIALRAFLDELGTESAHWVKMAVRPVVVQPGGRDASDR